MPAAVVSSRKLIAATKLAILAGALWAAPVVIMHATAFAFWNPPDRAMLEISAILVAGCFVVCTTMTAVLLLLTAVLPSLLRGSRVVFAAAWCAIALAMSVGVGATMRGSHDTLRGVLLAVAPAIATFTIVAAIQGALIHRYASRRPLVLNCPPSSETANRPLTRSSRLPQ